MKRILQLITALMLCIVFTGCKQEPQLSDDIYIFYTSDVHCGVEDNLTFAGVKALVNETKAEHPHTMLIDLGDYIQGGTLGSLSKGELIIELMNAMDYDIATFGNHEFDYGMEQLKKLIGMAEFDLTASNVIYTGNKENIFADVPAYIMKEFDGVKVALIGVLTPSSTVTSTPAYFQEDGEFVYDFYSGNEGKDLAAQVQKTVDEARSAGAKYVIAMTHLGSVPEDEPYDAISLIHNTSGIDAVLDGHAHAVIIGDYYPDKDGKDVLLSSVGTKLQNLGELIIGKDGTLSTVLISKSAKQDEEILKKLEEVHSELDVLLNEKVCDTAVNIPIADENGIRMVRARETGAGDLVTDAFRDALGTEIAMTNGGGVRSTIEAGEVTFNDVLAVVPFMNTLSAVRATGQQILDALEFGAQSTEIIYEFDGNAAGESGAFLQVSGLKYTIDTSIPSGIVLDENKMMTGIEGERRVKDVYVLKDGEYVPLDPQETYTVGGSTYILSANGDGNTAFSGSEILINGGLTDIDVLSLYLQKLGTIPESYAGPEGRITVK